MEQSLQNLTEFISVYAAGNRQNSFFLELTVQIRDSKYCSHNTSWIFVVSTYYGLDEWGL